MESIKACPKPEPGNSVALRVSDILTKPIHANGIENQDNCPVFDVKESEGCLYKFMAAQVAKNISDTVLKMRHCSQGTWQNLTQDCEKKPSMAALLGAKTSTLVFWSVCLILAMVLV